ncbi:hypothetical protein PHLCEN_2v11476 [Hermanssonia centrifuga]|uniref:Uncharacterized protein n=1 Tax=Hermanssonia centrifuga TaxID=98765 RepID=A0A2R6NKY9_9APHY|nr:hypothetical protein PHLCEN_2v11476 [Hermanssonia centrifuga]
MPGYESFSAQKYARRSAIHSRDLYSRGKVVKQVAEIIQKFITDNTNREVDAEHAQWRIGAGLVDIDRLFLTGLMRVSQSSFQPVLEVRTFGLTGIPDTFL